MFRDNIEGTVDFFANYIYPRPALQPEYRLLAANVSNIPIAAPAVQFIRPGRLYFSFDRTTAGGHWINQMAIYKYVDSGWSVRKILPIDGDVTNEIVKLDLEHGSYVATLIDRFGREGLKTHFEVMI